VSGESVLPLELRTGCQPDRCAGERRSRDVLDHDTLDYPCMRGGSESKATEREAQSDILAPYDAEFAEYVEINSWLLVFRRLLHPIDSNYVSKCLSHFQFQPELLLNRREKIGRFFGICGCGRQRSRVS